MWNVIKHVCRKGIVNIVDCPPDRFCIWIVIHINYSMRVAHTWVAENGVKDTEHLTGVDESSFSSNGLLCVVFWVWTQKNGDSGEVRENASINHNFLQLPGKSNTTWIGKEKENWAKSFPTGMRLLKCISSNTVSVSKYLHLLFDAYNNWHIWHPYGKLQDE